MLGTYIYIHISKHERQMMARSCIPGKTAQEHYIFRQGGAPCFAKLVFNYWFTVDVYIYIIYKFIVHVHIYRL